MEDLLKIYKPTLFERILFFVTGDSRHTRKENQADLKLVYEDIIAKSDYTKDEFVTAYLIKEELIRRKQLWAEKKIETKEFIERLKQNARKNNIGKNKSVGKRR